MKVGLSGSIRTGNQRTSRNSWMDGMVGQEALGMSNRKRCFQCACGSSRVEEALVNWCVRLGEGSRPQVPLLLLFSLRRFINGVDGFGRTPLVGFRVCAGSMFRV